MLALTRRIGEEIVVGEPDNPLGIIRIVDIHGDKVRLAFDFPRNTPINRKELAEQKLRNGSKSDPPADGDDGRSVRDSTTRQST